MKQLELRKALQRITNEHHIRDHMKEIEKLRAQFKHQVYLEREPPRKYNYSCFEYALGVYDDHDYIKIKLMLLDRNIENVFVNSSFIKYLIQNQILTEGDAIILYFNDDNPSHAGIIETEEIVISKWGNGNIYRHPIDEVPITYGCKQVNYKYSSETSLLVHFKEYLRLLGIEL